METKENFDVSGSPKHNKTRVLIASPATSAISGVSTHVGLLLRSKLAVHYELIHFQVGSEGRSEKNYQKLFRFFISPLQLGFTILRVKPHIVHLNPSMDMRACLRDFTYLLIAKLCGCKLVTQFHSGRGPGAKFKNRLLAWGMRRFLMWSDSVIVLSNQAAREFEEFDQRIQVEVIPNAIDSRSVLRNHQVTADFSRPLRLVYVGRLVKSKGLFEAVNAMALLRAKGVDFTFDIAGSGPDEKALLKCIEANGIADVVRLIGPVFFEQKDLLWDRSDIFVFPTYSEGLPYSLLEAMAAGCVPITCAVGGIPDVMINERHGIFVPVKDVESIAKAIQRLADCRDELQQMSQAAHLRVAQNYGIDSLVYRFSAVYERIG